MERFRWLLVLLLVIVPALAAAGRSTASTTAAAEVAWSRYDSEHFTVVSAKGESFSWQVIGDLERLRSMLVQLFPAGTFDQPVPTFFYLFPNADTSSPYRVAEGSSPGFFQPTPLGNYAALLNADGDFALESVLRQYLHAVIRLNLPRLPAWLRHGLASFYGSFEVANDEPRFGLPIRSHLYWLGTMSGGRWLAVDDLLTLEAPPSEPHAGTSFHAQSWLLVHYLLLGSAEDTSRVEDFVERIMAGETPAAAFAQAITGDLDALEKALRDYAARTTFNFLRFLGDDLSSDAVRVHPLGLAERHAILGELVAATQPTAASLAARHFRAALEADPSQARAHTGLGVLAERAGDHAAAEAHLERALAAAPDDPRASYRFASLRVDSLGGRRAASEEDEGRLEQAITALERAIAAEPSFAEAWALLGFARGLSTEPTDEAIVALERAAELLPGRTDIMFNLLLAYARAGRRSDVEAGIERLDTLGTDASTLARAREIRAQAIYREAVALVRKTELDAALPLLAEVLAATGDPKLKASVEALVPQLLPVAQHNRFAKRYLEILDLYRDGAIGDARLAAASLSPEAANAKQHEALTVLRAFLDTLE